MGERGALFAISTTAIDAIGLAFVVSRLVRKEFIVFDLYPRHSHRTPQQIAEDNSGSFEPKRAAAKSGENDPETNRRTLSPQAASNVLAHQSELNVTGEHAANWEFDSGQRRS